MAYSFVLTFVILKVLDMVMGLRVTEEEEVAGIDASQHGERAYLLDSGAPYAGIPTA
jgi:Amt family ammonium transporter